MAESVRKRKRARVQLVEVLIGAVCAGGPRLSRVRSEFERMDAADGLKRLVLQAVDPELLAAVVGPRLSPAWVELLRAQYARFKQAYPADWVDVEKVWREQRARWRRPGSTAASASTGSQAAARGYPERGVRDAGRAVSPRAVPRSSPGAPAARPASKVSAVHRPVPAGVAAVHEPGVEPVAAPPDPVVSGEAAADAVDADAADDARDAARKPDADRKLPRADVGASTDSVSGRGVNGAPADPPAPPRPAVTAERVPRDGEACSDDARIVFSGKAGALVERLLRAMADSRARVESVRRVWIDADGVVGGWDLWALDVAAIDRVRDFRGVVER